jgi:hypothetical protein
MKDISLVIGMGNMPKMKLPTLSVLLVIIALGFSQTILVNLVLIK